MQSLVSISDLSLIQIDQLLSLAQQYSEMPEMPQVLQGEIVANLFFEPSTRTLASFKIAAYRLGAKTIDIDGVSSALQKGESVEDTVRNIAAMGVKIFIIRHADNNLVFDIADKFPNLKIINAGSGSYQHPSQALLDILTIKQEKGSFSNLKVSIVGDIKHSRVAGSLLDAFGIIGVKDITLVAPPELLPTRSCDFAVENNLEFGLRGADVVVVLRFQKERMQKNNLEIIDEVAANLCISPESLNYANPDVILLHPGPVNIGVELTADAVSDHRTKILKQVSNGVFIRAAILTFLLT